MYISLQAIDISAPAEAALLSTNAITGILEFNILVLMLSAASNKPPYVLMWSKIASAFKFSASIKALFTFRTIPGPISSRISIL
ncbi:MAG: hypothetical protein BWY67_01719 [Bacteroidetes bacterium ADurb.Bin397]|nr:MAG: hypothetical protein BWY67_01719 [Bacteroidetes bacterium ADurb.Bin397]